MHIPRAGKASAEATKKNAIMQTGVLALGVAGLFMASISVLYIAGMFGLSSAVASQIVNAVTVGGWVLAVAMALVSGGIAGTAVATARWAITPWGKKVAIA